jgi:hypothetical protein
MNALTKVSELKIGDRVMFGSAMCEVDGFSGSSVTVHKIGSSIRAALSIRSSSSAFSDLENRVRVF